MRGSREPSGRPHRISDHALQRIRLAFMGDQYKDAHHTTDRRSNEYLILNASSTERLDAYPSWSPYEPTPSGRPPADPVSRVGKTRRPPDPNRQVQLQKLIGSLGEKPPHLAHKDAGSRRRRENRRLIGIGACQNGDVVLFALREK